MYVTGIGRTKFGVLDRSIPELAYEAMRKSLGDCKLPVKDIDAIFVANFVGGEFQNQLHLNSVVSSLLPGLNIPIFRVETACAAGGSSLYLALMSLSRFENVMVLGVEKMSGAGSLESASNIGMAGDRILDQAEGLIFPASYALSAQQHMRKYGTTLDDLANVAYKDHRNANLNEFAHFYGMDVSLDAIKNSPVVCSPLRLFDCSPISDGAAAAIVSKKRRTDRDVKVAASAIATDSISLAQRKVATTFPAAKIAAKQAYSQAKLSAKDIDVAEVHDCFTIAELIAMEDLGFCKPGESKEMIRSERTSLSGDLPINTDGGLKADGHPIGASGIAQVFEIVTQLRGEAKRRQVKGAKVGLTHNIGGIGGTAVVHILEGC
jgi:acetyl-CoA C-acetyltransferase